MPRPDDYDDVDEYFYDDDDDDENNWHNEDSDDDSAEADDDDDGWEYYEEEDEESEGDYTPHEPGALEISDGLRRGLATLAALDNDTSSPELDVAQVNDVEDALGHSIPDPILALMASKCDHIREFEIGIETIVDHTYAAHSVGVPKSYIAFGTQLDGHGYFCYEKSSVPLRGVMYMCEYDTDDDSQRNHQSIDDWVEGLVEFRQDGLARSDQTTVTDKQIRAYRPKLVE